MHADRKIIESSHRCLFDLLLHAPQDRGSCAQFLFSGEIKLEFDMLTESSWEGWSSEQYNNGLFDLLKASVLFSKMNWNEKKKCSTN